MRNYRKKRTLQFLYILLLGVNATCCAIVTCILHEILPAILTPFLPIFLYKMIREAIYQGFHRFGFYAIWRLEEIGFSYRKLFLPDFRPHTTESLKRHQQAGLALKCLYIFLDSILITICFTIWIICFYYQFEVFRYPEFITVSLFLLTSLMCYLLRKYGKKGLGKMFAKYTLAIEHGEPTFRKI
ncbi:hypothetical protein BU202_10010 [Streptococcus cuniculi]|uniref:Uncharacterized protein n=1 Tax=Streptococcus cuniculi TaxID=1432788 RepID=A0A1Q8E5C1_9STRE|nr:hypothetical protein BU202_10010 [Streptococcus cuniculi]